MHWFLQCIFWIIFRVRKGCVLYFVAAKKVPRIEFCSCAPYALRLVPIKILCTTSPPLFEPQSICVAGMALIMALSWIWWRAWSPLVARAPRHFVWHPWHLATSTFHLRRRRGTWRHPRSIGPRWSHGAPRHFAWQAWHVWHWAGSGGALWSPGAPRHFASQAWHLATSTFVFAWQGWHLATSTFVLRGTQLLHIHTHNSSTFTYICFFHLSILHHLLCLSFLPRPASTLISHYWKKLTCGVIGSFNSFLLLRSPPRVPGR